jgi:hypothetical protein
LVMRITRRSSVELPLAPSAEPLLQQIIEDTLVDVRESWGLLWVYDVLHHPCCQVTLRAIELRKAYSTREIRSLSHVVRDILTAVAVPQFNGELLANVLRGCVRVVNDKPRPYGRSVHVGGAVKRGDSTTDEKSLLEYDARLVTARLATGVTAGVFSYSSGRTMGMCSA